MPKVSKVHKQVETLAVEWIEDLLMTKSVKQETASRYAGTIHSLITWCARTGTHPYELQPWQLERFLRRWRRPTYGKYNGHIYKGTSGTRRREMSAVWNFYGWLHRNGHTKQHVLRGREMWKVTRLGAGLGPNGKPWDTSLRNLRSGAATHPS